MASTPIPLQKLSLPSSHNLLKISFYKYNKLQFNLYKAQVFYYPLYHI